VNVEPAEREDECGFPVETPTYSGPLELLLHLIRKNKVSIYDIPIAVICDQYHDHLQQMHELDLEVAGEFISMASWLLYLKSRLLLPRAQEGEGDPRAELVDRLLQYRRVKELATVLYEKDVVRRCLWPAHVAYQAEPDEIELDWEDVDLRTLAQTYLAVMQRFAAAHPPPLQVIPLRYTVEDKMRHLYRRVRTDGLVQLVRHLNSLACPEEVVTLVVAVLELVRLGGVQAEQSRQFGEIYLRPGPHELSSDQLTLEEETGGS
jgi:segregation and condensation protein A